MLLVSMWEILKQLSGRERFHIPVYTPTITTEPIPLKTFRQGKENREFINSKMFFAS